MNHRTIKPLTLGALALAALLAAPGIAEAGDRGHRVAKHRAKKKAGAVNERRQNARERRGDKKDKAKERRDNRRDGAREGAGERRDQARERAQERRDRVRDRHDANGDGSVDRKERRDAADKRRDELKSRHDADGDGRLSKEERQNALKERRDNLQDRAEERIDNRQDRQDRRIEHGIEKGYLTESEIDSLRTAESALAAKEAAYLGDGKLTRKEARDIKTDLNELSRDIWINKHDTEGNQMPVYRISKDAKLKKEVAELLDGGDVDKAMARRAYNDMKKMKELQRKLSDKELTEEQRTRLENQYGKLAERYFIFN